MKRICSTALLAFCLIVASMTAVQAQTPQETLRQYVSDLQNSPNDYTLRGRIIKHVQTLKRPPAIPEDARRYFIEGNALLKAAKDPKGYGLAIDAYRQCLLIAPWWSEANYNYAVALDLASKFDEAMSMLKLYIATDPGEEESRKAQDKIYEIGAKKIIAAKEKEELTANAASEARAKAEEEAKATLDSIAGAWAHELGGRPSPDFIMQIRKNSNNQWSIEFPSNSKLYAYDIKQIGKGISFTRMSRGSDPELNTDYYNLTLSPDGTRLMGTIRSVSISGNSPHWVTDETTWYRQ